MGLSMGMAQQYMKDSSTLVIDTLKLCAMSAVMLLVGHSH